MPENYWPKDQFCCTGILYQWVSVLRYITLRIYWYTVPEKDVMIPVPLSLGFPLNLEQMLCNVSTLDHEKLGSPILLLRDPSSWIFSPCFCRPRCPDLKKKNNESNSFEYTCTKKYFETKPRFSSIVIMFLTGNPGTW